MFENRKYVIISTTELSNINFNEVLETAPNTCRFNVDGSSTFIKYDGEMPASVAAIESKSQEYTHEEILAILATPEWTTPMEEL